MSESPPGLAAILDAVRREDRAKALRLSLEAWRAGVVHPLVLMLAAEGLQAAGEGAQAVALLERALDLTDEPEIWRRYGVALLGQERATDAVAAFEEALDIDPRDLQALALAGRASFQSGELVAADSYYDRALALDPLNPEVLRGAAAVAVRRKAAGRARDLARRVLAAAPLDLSAAMTLIRADLLEAQTESARAAAAALLERPDLPDDARLAAFDLRAEALDALDRPAEAFADYAARNAVSERQAAPHLAQMGERRLDQALRLAKVFYGADRGAWLTGCGPDAEGAQAASGHVFLIGFPRSGTTLLEKALGSHPGVATLEEVDVLAGAGVDLLDSPGGLSRLQNLSSEQAAIYRRAYWSAATAALGPDAAGKVVVDKMPLHTLALPLIARLFPDARILFALRDPRDVVLSCFRRRFRVNSAMYEFLTLERAAAYYDAVMRLAEVYRDRLPLRLVEVRHEAVVADFDREVGAVLEFSGLPWNADVRRFAERAQQRARTPSDLQLTDGLKSDGLGQWRRFAPQMSSVRDLLDPWAQRFGYPI